MVSIVSICGSRRRGSYNRMLMQALPGLAPPGMGIAEAPSFAGLPLRQQLEAFATFIERHGRKP